MINNQLSIIIPFYNPPYEIFTTCLRNTQTIAHFCQLENLFPEQLAMLNFRYGAKARNMLKQHIYNEVQA